MCGKRFIYWLSPIGCGLLPGALTSPTMLGCPGTAWGQKIVSGHLRLNARRVKRTRVGAELSVCTAVAEITGDQGARWRGPEACLILSFTLF